MPIAPLAAVLVTLLPSSDVPAIARAYAREAARPLWPGFEPAGIPVLLFDGTDTWLLGHPSPPAEFEACADPAGGAVHRGRHAESRANTAVEIAGVACASLLADLSRGADQLAATAIHEAFHVWQDAHVPGWSANEGDLFTLPFDDPERLAERRIETELLRRALASTGEERARFAWAAVEARAGRAERDPGSVAYERGIELREGLAQYVQYLAQQDDSVRVAEAGYAADDLRTRGYATGEAWARLCDACAPGWKGRLSDGVRPALDELLREALAASGAAHAAPTLDLSALTARAHADAAALQERRARHRAEFLAAPGWTLELAPARPVFPSAFDPLNVELVAPGEVLHGRWLRVEWDGGSLEVLDRPCLTVAAGEHPLFEGAARVVVTGLAKEPAPRAEPDGWSTWTGAGVTLRVRAADLTRDAERQVVRLVPR